MQKKTLIIDITLAAPRPFFLAFSFFPMVS